MYMYAYRLHMQHCMRHIIIMYIMSCINTVVGEDKALPGIVRIKTTVGNRRHRILSLDVHSVKNECVCVHIIFNNSMYSVCKVRE